MERLYELGKHCKSCELSAWPLMMCCWRMWNLESKGHWEEGNFGPPPLPSLKILCVLSLAHTYTHTHTCTRTRTQVKLKQVFPGLPSMFVACGSQRSTLGVDP